jgi:ubiquinone/menaquinone biosynthesis C-methylase UbiE
MGVWSRLAGDEFLDWLAPAPGLRWIDVGCGNGAFTDLIARRAAPAGIVGVDPSAGQIAFARTRLAAAPARFEQAGAAALPVADAGFDVATMALVIFFVPDPAQGVAEMRRVVRPGGTIAAYAWDVLEPGGFPMAALQAELRAMGIAPMLPPSPEASRIEALHGLWSDAGLIDVTTRVITVARTYDDFEDYWATAEIAMNMAASARGLDVGAKARLRQSLRAALPSDPAGRITLTARANAVSGRVPG